MTNDMSDLHDMAWSQLSKTDGWSDFGHCSMLMDFVLQHRPKTIVEIGIFGGRSLAAIGFALRHLGEGYVIGIDPWSKEAACEGENEKNIEWWSNLDIEAIYIRFMQNIIAMGLTKECRWLRATAEEAVHFFKDGSIELLNLDANHSELVSCRQVTQWMPKIASKGILTIDDCDWQSQAKALQMVRQAGFVVFYDAGSWMAFQKP